MQSQIVARSPRDNRCPKLLCRQTRQTSYYAHHFLVVLVNTCPVIVVVCVLSLSRLFIIRTICRHHYINFRRHKRSEKISSSSNMAAFYTYRHVELDRVGCGKRKCAPFIYLLFFFIASLICDEILLLQTVPPDDVS